MILDSNPQKYPVHGYLLDGQSAVQQPLAIKLAKGGIAYLLTSGKNGFWSYADTDWDHSPMDAAPLYLKSRSQHDKWLVLTDRLALRHVGTAQKKWSHDHLSLVYQSKLHAVAVILWIFIAIAAVWMGWPFIADGIAAKAPPGMRAWVDPIGDDYLKTFKLCRTPEADLSLRLIKERLAQGDERLLSQELIIADVPVVNAFTLPGHKVVINRGMLRNARDGDEVASVLAHEFGHVLNDHVFRGAIRRSLPSLLTAMLSKTVGGMPQAADMVIDKAYSRQFERDADATGLILIQRAGIPAKAWEDLFKRMDDNFAGDKKNHFAEFIEDHPEMQERIAVVDKLVVEQERTGVGRSVLSQDQWLALKKVCGETRP
jgi:Zn-dependent protease with chaperone function